MLIDTHCHLDFKEFEQDRPDVIKRSIQEGIRLIINVGSSIQGSMDSVEIAETHESVYAAIGIHPHEADRIKEEDLSLFKKFFDKKKIVAVGEIGLDYYRNISSKDNQKKLFIRLLKEAGTRHLPVIIHNREAHEDTLSILQDIIGPEIKGVMHCFSGDKIFLAKCLDAGLYISFTCNITFKNSERLREVVKSVPLERLLLETDSPFLAPQVFRGRRNEPSYIRYLAEEIAGIKNLDFEKVAEVTTENAKALFGI